MNTNLDVLKKTLNSFKEQAETIYTKANEVTSHSQQETNELIDEIFTLQGFMDRVRTDYSSCTQNFCAKAQTLK